MKERKSGSGLQGKMASILKNQHGSKISKWIPFFIENPVNEGFDDFSLVWMTVVIM